MKKAYFITLAILGLSFSVTFNACKKDSSSGVNSDIINTTTDHIRAMSIVNLIFSEVEEALVDVGELKSANTKFFSDCAEVYNMGVDGEYETSLFIYDDSCDRNGFSISGSMMVESKALDYWVGTGTKRTIYIDSLVVNNYFVSGNITIGYEGKDYYDQPILTLRSDSCRFYDLLNNNFFTAGFYLTKTWLVGYDKQFRITDQYAITGTSWGTNRDNFSYIDSISTIDSLKILHPAACQWIERGHSILSYAGEEITIEYGTENNCDNRVAIKSNGSSNTIEIGF
jgi:hypothetical protein